jgi:putative redox protein
VAYMAKIKGKAKLIENTCLITENGRGHSVICDLPESDGGKNSGPSPLELALMALAGCGVIIYADVCKNSKIDPGKIEIDVEGEEASPSPVIQNVAMKVHITSKNRKALTEAAWRRTEANCPVLCIYKKPIPVKVEVDIKTP